MDSNTFLWITAISNFIGGGLIVRLIDLYLLRGKMIIHEYSVLFSYVVIPQQNGIHYIRKVTLELQCINSSGTPCVINDIKTRYYDGVNYQDFYIENQFVNPADVISEKSTKLLKFELLPPSKDIECPISGLEYNTYFEILYKVDNKALSKKFVDGNNIKLKDITRYFAG